jgi:ribonuclease R
MASRIGGRFAARISGVTRFGLFVTVTETGASGIVPFATLPEDYWQYDEREQTVTGRHTRKVYRLAQEVDVLLSDANPVTGGMVFHVLERDERSRNAPSGKRPRRR